MGRQFIQGFDTTSIAVEGWIFFCIFVGNKGMTVHGTFNKSRKHIQTRRGLEFNGFRMISNQKVIQFTTQQHFTTFDLLFGKYVRFGSKQRSRVNKTVQNFSHDHLFHMGNGKNNSEYQFQRRNLTDYGIDLFFDAKNSSLTVSVQYQLQRVSENLSLTNIIRERVEFDGEQQVPVQV